MKRKVISIALIIAVIAIAIVSASYAYFTDTDFQKNTFVVGNVRIDLYEDFNTAGLHLVPAIKCPTFDQPNEPCTECGITNCDSCVKSGWHNAIEKEVYVENTGSEPAYVRVHIAVPDLSRLDGTKTNAITLASDPHDTVDGKWCWGSVLEQNYPSRDNVADQKWNRYNTIIVDGAAKEIPYKVFVVTYESVLAPDAVTEDAIARVYMQPDITQEDVAAWDELYGCDSEYGNGWNNVYVVAEAVQASGFSDAITALNAAFGDPMADGYVAPAFTSESNGKTFIEVE